MAKRRKNNQGPTTVTITKPGEDCLEVWWYGDGEVFISLRDAETGGEHLTTLGPDACQALIIALQQSQQPAPAPAPVAETPSE